MTPTHLHITSNSLCLDYSVSHSIPHRSNLNCLHHWLIMSWFPAFSCLSIRRYWIPLKSPTMSITWVAILYTIMNCNFKNVCMKCAVHFPVHSKGSQQNQSQDYSQELESRAMFQRSKQNIDILLKELVS